LYSRQKAGLHGEPCGSAFIIGIFGCMNDYSFK
jgi:hypothetical protein